jgi:pilus assembly protein CpaF
MSLSKRLNGDNTEAQGLSYPHIGDKRERISRQSAERVDEEFLKQIVYEKLFIAFGPDLYSGNVDSNMLERLLYESLTQAVEEEKLSITSLERATLIQSISDEILGLGPLQPLIRDSSITEIMVNGFDNIYVEKLGKILKTSRKFHDENHLRRTIERIVSLVGRRIDESSPLVDARLSDGTRVNAVVPPISIDGSSLTLRKFSTEPLTMKDLLAYGTLTIESKELLELCVSSKLNIVISGGTGSGKTTLLNVLSGLISKDERIITIEDAAELRLLQPHIIRLESRPSNAEGRGAVSIRDLVRNSLRMRPDRIVVGEVRDAAALDMLQAMNTGHDGSLTTVHANTPKDAVSRIETMVLMAGLDLPVTVIREQIASAVDILIQQSRMRDGSRKITQISEVTGIDSGVVQLQDLFIFKSMIDAKGVERGKLQSTGLPLQGSRNPGN